MIRLDRIRNECMMWRSLEVVGVIGKIRRTWLRDHVEKRKNYEIVEKVMEKRVEGSRGRESVEEK